MNIPYISTIVKSENSAAELEIGINATLENLREDNPEDPCFSIVDTIRPYYDSVNKKHCAVIIYEIRNKSELIK